MITGEYWKLQDDNALRKMDAAAIHLLEKGGCRIEHGPMLDLLEGIGCRINRETRRAFFPEKIVRAAVQHLGGKTSEQVQIPAGWNPQHNTGHGGSFPHLLDWPSGQRRLATRQDVRDMARMAHVLPEFVKVGKALTCIEVDQQVEPLWAVLEIAGTTDKQMGAGEIFHANYIEPLVRMGEVLSGKANDTTLLVPCDFFIEPLILDGDRAECFIAKRKFGMPITPGTMPISGISAPVTIAGTVTVAVAELLAGWVMGYACNPAVPAGGIVCSGSLDMRTVTACFGSPEALLQNATVVSLCRRLYGIAVRAATTYVDCKRPGLEAVFQKMYALVGAPVGTGTTLYGYGLLSAGQDYSPVQHMLDLEINKAVERFWGHYEVNDETIALDLIENMLTADRTNFLDTDHTLQHYKAQQWYPRWLDRTAWKDGPYETQAEHKMLQEIDRYCKGAIARYERPVIDPARLAELRRIFLAAERKILGANVTAL